MRKFDLIKDIGRNLQDSSENAVLLMRNHLLGHQTRGYEQHASPEEVLLR